MSTSITVITETMTSTQLASLLGYEKKEVNRKIKEMFSDKITGGEIPLENSRYGGVEEYYLNELQSTMFVGKWNNPFLKQLSEFWIAHKHQQLPMSTGNPMLDAMIVTQQQLNETKEEVKVLTNTMVKQSSLLDGLAKSMRGVKDTKVGYINSRDAHRWLCNCVSYNVFKQFAINLNMPSIPYRYFIGDTNTIADGKQFKTKHVVDLANHIQDKAAQVTPKFYTHPDYKGRFQLN